MIRLSVLYNLSRQTVTSCILLLAVKQAAAGSYGSSNCRCSTTDATCFPDKATLDAFNITVQGRLVVPRPTAYPCYPGAGFDSDSCSAVVANWPNASFRTENPGTMESWNLEELGTVRCALQEANVTNAVCHQARVPLYGVETGAVSLDFIEITLAFAKAHNLKLFIKNTGHDYLGRSVQVGVFMLWSHDHQGVIINQTFSLTGCATQPTLPGPVITIQGGPEWEDIYAAVSAQTNDTSLLMGGFCPSVGGGGGFILGGGHGAMSPSYGLAVDHVLEFQLLTADGVVRVVNQCTDPDLFWALKGGGGGTFGFLVSVTYQLLPAPPALSSFQMNLTPPPGVLLNETILQEIITTFILQAPSIDGARWGGYLELNPRVGFAVTFLLPLSVADANATVWPFVEAFMPLVNRGVVTINPRQMEQPNFWTWRKNHIWPGTNFDLSGLRGVIGTRLIPFESVLADPVAVGQALAQAAFQSDNFVGFVVAGQGVRERDQDHNLTSVNPAWRKAFMQAEVLNVWDYDTDQNGINDKKNQLNAALDIWRKMWPTGPTSGAYFNEAYFETDWQQAFWGANYDRLLSVKQRVDPDGVFTCQQCVGSEFWDSTGFCRNPQY